MSEPRLLPTTSLKVMDEMSARPDELQAILAQKQRRAPVLIPGRSYSTGGRGGPAVYMHRSSSEHSYKRAAGGDPPRSAHGRHFFAERPALQTHRPRFTDSGWTPANVLGLAQEHQCATYDPISNETTLYTFREPHRAFEHRSPRPRRERHS